MTGVVTDALRWWAQEVPGQTAVSVDGDDLTYRELDAWSDAVADHLDRRGVRPGDRIGVVGDNCLEWVVSAVAVIKVRAVPFLINFRFVAEEIAHLVHDTEAVGVIAADGWLPAVQEAIAVSGEQTWLEPFATIGELQGVGGPRRHRIDVSFDAPLVIVYTSGSTGRPKGVVITHRSHSAMVFEWSIMGRGYRRGMRWLCSLPIGTMPSFVWGFLLTVYHGGSAYILRKPDAAEMLRVAESERITVLSGVPTIFERAARDPGFAAADLSSVEHAQTGGARVSSDLLGSWMGKGVRLQQTYGMTEAGGSFTTTPYSRAIDKATTCGSGGIFSPFRVVRPDGTDCDDDEAGEILIRTQARAVGYWTRGGRIAPLDLTPDGWLRTGDIGRRDPEGYLVFVDRAKEIIISGGMNVSPLEIENVIADVPGIEEVAVIAVPDGRFGEVPGAIVYGSAPIDPAAIVAACRARLAGFKVPHRIVVAREPLPRLGGGKLARNEIRQQYSPALRETVPLD